MAGEMDAITLRRVKVAVLAGDGVATAEVDVTPAETSVGKLAVKACATAALRVLPAVALSLRLLPSPPAGKRPSPDELRAAVEELENTDRLSDAGVPNNAWLRLDIDETKAAAGESELGLVLCSQGCHSSFSCSRFQPHAFSLHIPALL